MSPSSTVAKLFVFVTASAAILSIWIQSEGTTCFVSQNIVSEHSVCTTLLNGGVCAMVPWMTRLLCPMTCGWCEKGENKVENNIQTNKKWKQIDKVHISNITYEEFLEKYKKPGIPVVIQGWLEAQPSMVAWGWDKLEEVCGDRNVSLVQRRAHVLSDIQKEVSKSSVLSWVLDTYLWFRFDTSLEKLILEANRKVTVRELLARIKSEKVDVDFRSPLDYLGSSFSVNDFPVASICPEFARDLMLPMFSVKESLHFHKPELDRRQSPNIFIEAHGGIYNVNFCA
jgi:hypothetical protein